MADNGVKPHTTVTVTTQSGLAPQVCFNPSLALPATRDGYRTKSRQILWEAFKLPFTYNLVKSFISLVLICRNSGDFLMLKTGSKNKGLRVFSYFDL